MKLFSTFAILFFLSLPAFATSTQPAFDALKNVSADYSPTGQICEQVTRLQLAEKYLPGDYDITVGIEYSVGGRTIGELDVVVVDKKSQSVALVAEVKCWKSMSGGLSKAHKQRARFLRTLSAQPGQMVFQAKEGGQFAANQFQQASFITVAQSGAKSNGFDDELPYSLRELMDLRGDMIDCQARGECAAP